MGWRGILDDFYGRSFAEFWNVPSNDNHKILNMIRGTCQGGIRMLNYFEQTRRFALPQQPDTMLCSYGIQDDDGCCRS